MHRLGALSVALLAASCAPRVSLELKETQDLRAEFNRAVDHDCLAGKKPECRPDLLPEGPVKLCVLYTRAAVKSLEALEEDACLTQDVREVDLQMEIAEAACGPLLESISYEGDNDDAEIDGDDRFLPARLAFATASRLYDAMLDLCEQKSREN